MLALQYTVLTVEKYSMHLGHLSSSTHRLELFASYWMEGPEFVDTLSLGVQKRYYRYGAMWLRVGLHAVVLLTHHVEETSRRWLSLHWR